MSSHYETLGVARDASDSEIRAAYRQLAREWHPDGHPKAEREVAAARFRAISEAYSVLADPAARQTYDLEAHPRSPASAWDSPRCFYHPTRPAEGACPVCGRAVCAACKTSDSCRVCELSEATPSAEPKPATTYATAMRGGDSDPTTRSLPSPVGMIAHGALMFGAASAWVSLVAYPRVWSGEWSHGLTVAIAIVLSLPGWFLLRRQTRRAGRAIGIASAVGVCGAAVIWALMPWLGDRLAGVNVAAAESCYVRGSAIIGQAPLTCAANARYRAGLVEIDRAVGSLMGERRTTASALRGLEDEIMGLIMGEPVSAVDLVGARESLQRADEHFARSYALDPDGPGTEGRAMVARLRAYANGLEPGGTEGAIP